jgi:hypothetical protein
MFWIILIFLLRDSLKEQNPYTVKEEYVNVGSYSYEVNHIFLYTMLSEF